MPDPFIIAVTLGFWGGAAACFAKLAAFRRSEKSLERAFKRETERRRYANWWEEYKADKKPERFY